MTLTAEPPVESAASRSATRAKTILLCIPSGTPAANLLRTGVLDRLCESPLVGRVVIASPLVSEAHFRAEFGHDKVGFAELQPHEPGWLERRIIRVLQERYVKTMPTASMRIRVARERRLELAASERRYLDRGSMREPTRLLPRLAMQVVKRLPLSLPTLFKALDTATLGDAYADLFARERPDLVVTPTTGIYFAEGPLMGRADRAGVPILAVDLSWDHFTTKTAPLRRVAGLAVWNRVMKEQAVTIHGYRPDQVAVTGVPQFDHYVRATTFKERDQYIRDLGGDPSKKLITLTTVPPVLYPFHDVVIDELVAALRMGALGMPVQLLVRAHPRDDVGKYDRFRDEPDVIIEKPFRETIVAEGSNVDPSTADRDHLANTLKHSDVIVNVASTIAIEAAIMDTPVVNIAFDGHEQREFLDSARRFYEYTHYKPLVQSGGVRVAYGPAEMVDLVRGYLADPGLDRDGRERTVAEQCHQVDGHAADRVAAYILGFLERVP
jgi:hypothetical protein